MGNWQGNRIIGLFGVKLPRRREAGRLRWVAECRPEPAQANLEGDCRIAKIGSDFRKADAQIQRVRAPCVASPEMTAPVWTREDLFFDAAELFCCTSMSDALCQSCQPSPCMRPLSERSFQFR